MKKVDRLLEKASTAVGRCYTFGRAYELFHGKPWKEVIKSVHAPFYMYLYALDVIKGRWPEAEPYIMRSPDRAYSYAHDIIGGRWPEAEPIIMKSPMEAYWYARGVIKGHWPEAEPYIKKNVCWWDEYKIAFGIKEN